MLFRSAQIALKSQACSIGSRVVFLGSGPLLYLVAYQYLKAGANIAAVLDTARLSDQVAALPKLLARPALLRQGLSYLAALRRAGVALHSGAEPVAIGGDPQDGVRRLKWRDNGGREHAIDCDAIALGYHLRPETQLADLAGCKFVYDDNTRQWFPQVSMEGRSSVPMVYLAGEIGRAHV